MESPTSVRIEALLAQRDWVRALARTLVRDPAAADDLEQQAWVEALARPPAHGEGLRGWFATILRRRARDARREGGRRARREEAAARPAAVRSTAEVVAEAEAQRRVVEAVLGLEAPYREAVLLRYFEDLPPREVAERTGVPVETVRTRARRALERLREVLDRGSGGDRAAWVAALLPLAGIRPEAAAAVAAGGGAGGAAAAGIAGGAVMATKATVAAAAAGVLAGAVLGGVAGGVLVRPPDAAGVEEARAEVRDLRAKVEALEAGRGGGGPALPPEVEERVGAQERRIAGLEAALAEVRSRPAAPAPDSPGPRRDPAAAAEGRPADAARVEALAKELLASEQKMIDEKRRFLEAARATVEELQRKFLDTSLPDADRATALSGLRAYKEKGIDRTVIAAIPGFFRGVADAELRESLLRDLHGTKDPELKQVFVEALRSDPDEKVRERAARDIDNYLEDPAVRQALEAARDGDASPGVRARAERTLKGAEK